MLQQVTRKRNHAQQDIRSRIVNKEQCLFIWLARAAIRPRIHCVKTPRPWLELCANLPEIHRTGFEHFLRVLCAHVEDIAGKDAFDHESIAIIMTRGIQLIEQAGQERQGTLVLCLL